MSNLTGVKADYDNDTIELTNVVEGKKYTVEQAEWLGRALLHYATRVHDNRYRRYLEEKDNE